MKIPSRTVILPFVYSLIAVAGGQPQSASAENIVEQRIVINWGVWNWDTYGIHPYLHVGSGVPDGRYHLYFTENNGVDLLSKDIEIVNGQSLESEWVWANWGYQARLVPDGGRTTVALYATGFSGPAQGINVPAAGEATVWRFDSYYLDGDVPPDVYLEFDLPVYLGSFPPPSPTPLPNWKCTDDKSGGDQENCQGCNSAGMARYSVHSMLVSLNIEDTPLRYRPPRGPAVNFTLTYNEKENQQPVVFSYSNLGPKWTLEWLSYVTDNPVSQMSSAAVYVPGGGTEIYSFDPVTQTFSRDPQSHALLVRTGPNSYEKKFPDGSRQIFRLSSGATTYPRKIFMTQMIDPAGNAVSIGFDNSRRVATVTDSLGRVTTVSYELVTDPLKITRVTDPFGRFATFQYQNGKLKSITDEIGIRSEFAYSAGTDSISSLSTPYGTTTFARGANGTNRWIEITDPLGAKERVEYRDNAPGISPTEAVAPNAPGIVNSGLDTANTFYWDKKAMESAAGDYSKARIKHWLYNANGSVSGVISSEKQPLENRVWYTYAEQPDFQHVGASANPVQVARVLGDGTTQLFQYEHNALGKMTRSIDPAGRVLSYLYDLNQVDLLESRQSTGTSDELLRRFTYDSSHNVLTETDAAGQVTAFSYNAFGQILTRTNAKNETVAYAYGGSAPAGYLASITSPALNGNSTVVRLGYDAFNRVRTITSEEDQYTIATDFDNLDRKIKITYPDGTYEQFQYSDNVTGLMTLDLTGSRDRMGRWIYRHYNANRKLDAVTDPLSQVTLYEWCACGALACIEDPNQHRTTFRRDLQGRVFQKVFADGTTVDYLFEGQTAPNTVGATSRLQSVTDALHRRVNLQYAVDDNISQISFTDLDGNSLNPATPSVSYSYDPLYNRVVAMSDGTGLTSYAYYPVDSSPVLGAGKLRSIDGPLTHDTVTFTYDELGRTVGRSIDNAKESFAYDSLGRLTAIDNALGHFERQYEKLSSRLQTVIDPNGRKTTYTYHGNEHDRRLQSLQNLGSGGANLSRFDYEFNPEGQIISLGRRLGTASSPLWFEYDDAQRLVTARNAATPDLASQRYDYVYDAAGNRMRDSDYDPRPVPGGWMNGSFATYTSNALNQLDSRSLQVNNQPPLRGNLAYDVVGNLTNDGFGTTFEWDAVNRLIAVRHENGNRTEFAYDGLGRIVLVLERTKSAVIKTRRFVWIGNRIAQERDENDVLVRRYFAEGEQRTTRAERGDYYYALDHLGSIREVTDKLGTVQARYDYDPSGKRTKMTGQLDFDLGYAGYFHHEPSGLDFARHRAYDSILGRWISRDPIAERGGLNLYQYVGNDPVNATDPTGLFKVYGNWCGPDWTGGRKEAYAPNSSSYYQPPVSALDAACETHDICYYQCRANHGCNGETRSQCFRECDQALTSAANSYGGVWGRIIALAMDRPGTRDPEQNSSSCCQKGR